MVVYTRRIMGFLDRLVSDLVQESTGLPARRMVRKIGGKNILLAAGGALLASGVAKKLGENQSTTATSGAASGMPPPPPPPPPGAAASGVVPPPPPPPPPASESALAPDEPEIELPRELTYAVVRTMVAAAIADGEMASEEKEMVWKHLGDSGLDDEQKQQIHRDLMLPASPEELAELAPAAEAREVLYRFAALVALSDRNVVASEREWLRRLADAFELSDERRQELESEVFSEDEE